ncbi:MAG: T9SS type A sorting domain-containing protein [Bacteroidota bacterium]
MKKLILFSIIFSFNNLMAQQFYNRYPSSLDLHIYTTTDVLELNNAYYKIETESNNSMSFHSNIRIIKTDANGTIIWTKRYDAGIDSSLVATSINKTLDNNIIVNSVLANDNAFPPIGVSIIKLDTSGAVLWTILFPGFRAGYYGKNAIQLPDSSYVIDAESSASLNSCVIKLNTSATAVSSKVFMNMVYTGSNSITSMILKNNIFSISFNHGEFITTDTAFNMLSDKNYCLDPTGAYFTHTVAANGDYIFIDDIIAGGLLNGLFRIFRTDSTGNLIWAKSLTIWKSFTIQTPFTLYDVTQGVKVFEDTSLNIVAHLLDEGGVGLAVTFDANGNYITNKVIKAAEMKLCADGDFVFVSNLQFANSLGIFAKQLHYSINNCDSLIDVQISSGTDSASTVATATNSVPVPISLTNFPVNVSNVSLNPLAYCPVSTSISDNNKINESGMIIYPDPSSRYISVSLPGNYSNAEIKIFNLTGKLIVKSMLLNSESNIDISDLPDGIYFLEMNAGKTVIRHKFVKQ